MEEDDDNQPRRNNGLEWPLHGLQVLSWVLLLFFPIMFGVFTGPFFRSPHSYIWITFYCIAYGFTILTDAVTMHSDPVDPGANIKLSSAQLQEESPSEQTPCYYCKSLVHESSKHCRTCNKCIIGFDHHCKWLNNCVGSKNYKLFLLFVFITMISLTLQFALILFQFIDSFYDAWYAFRADQLYSMDLWLWQGIIGAVGVLALIADGLLVHLYSFHVWLALQGMSTYDWILKRREARHKKQAEKERQGNVLAVEEMHVCDTSPGNTADGSNTADGKAPSLPPLSPDAGVCPTPVTSGRQEQHPHFSGIAFKPEESPRSASMPTHACRQHGEDLFNFPQPHLVSDGTAGYFAARNAAEGAPMNAAAFPPGRHNCEVTRQPLTIIEAY